MRNKKLKISYNDFKPYLSVANDKILEETVEGGIIQSFKEKNNLTLELIDEQWTWGMQDESGTWLGVIGRV